MPKSKQHTTRRNNPPSQFLVKEHKRNIKNLTSNEISQYYKVIEMLENKGADGVGNRRKLNFQIGKVHLREKRFAKIRIHFCIIPGGYYVMGAYGQGDYKKRDEELETLSGKRMRRYFELISTT